ncbi:threonine/serine ThrE exporter family protein [Luteimonas sp. MHLX1A]|uniref:threonine/serine ThrE exporter family protein n=1 Tax=Alterluteimonas muca TaxID=2878684 RepID=UPI001E599127|nr:threonine/serine exporter family protein [Luteimonas sp. MHLX1A]MCD9045462.1 threonine/serine exporter family protein [Luteimonas sp. MHLX1A]
MDRPSPHTYGYAARIAFVVELAEHLHAYGTTAQRLEGAVTDVCEQLQLHCEPWVNPTGMVLSFNDPHRPPGDSDTTRVIRAAPGDLDLSKLSEVDRITEEVVAGRLDLSEGHAALLALDLHRPDWRGRLFHVLAYGMVAAGIAGLWRLPWLDIATASAIGVLLGQLDAVTRRSVRMRESADAIAGMIAGLVAIAVAGYVAPLNLNTVIIASLIVMLPGMALTNAVNELTSQHLVSGTVRFAGALTTVMKLTVGTMIALTAAQLAGVEPQVRAWRPQPDWVEWAAMLVAAFAFAVLFRAPRRDYVLVMSAAIGGYLISRYVGLALGASVGLFASALLVTAAGNGYARWANRPGAVIRVPGIIMLVPGSASLRGLMSLFQQQDVAVGQQAMLGVLNIILALVAGLMFGNLLLPARKSL